MLFKAEYSAGSARKAHESHVDAYLGDFKPPEHKFDEFLGSSEPSHADTAGWIYDEGDVCTLVTN